MTEHTSICRFCHANCGILVEVDETSGRPLAVRGDRANPAYHGFTCAKGRQLAAAHTHPDRLCHSQKRTEAGDFAAISSEQAMDEIAERVSALVERYGPRSVAIYPGTYSGVHPASIPFSIGWLFALGSRMLFTASTIDQPGKSIANALHGRWLGGSNVFDESDVWMLVGNNPLISLSGGIPPANPGRRLREAKARGMKFIAIDPRRTEVARFADHFLQPKPGEDPALIAAMLRLILDEQLFDADFVAENVSGFAALEAAVEPFTLDAAALRCGVEAEDIAAAARCFAQARRGCAVAGTGPNMSGHGNLTEYLLLALNTVCGRWRREGEAVANPGVLLSEAQPVAQASPAKPAWGFGEKLRIRDFTLAACGLPTSALADEILLEGEGQIRALICIGSNPLAAWPDQLKTHAAMQKLDLLVTLDPKLSATSKLAHYVVAPKMSLEVPGLSVSMEALEQTYVAMGYSEPYAQYTPAVAEPPAGADVIEEWEFFYGLAQRMGLDLTLYPIRAETGVRRARRNAVELDMARKPSSDEVLALLSEGSRVPLATLKQHPHGALFPDPPIHVAPKEPDCEACLEVGDATMLGELREIAREIAGVPGKPASTRPFKLISRRLPNAYNSSGRDIDALSKGRGYNPAFMHPEDLAALGLAEGSIVHIESDRARIVGVLAEAPELRRGVISMAHCFGDVPEYDGAYDAIGSNTGRLVSVERDYDPYSGIPLMSGIPVTVSAVSELADAGA